MIYIYVNYCFLFPLVRLRARALKRAVPRRQGGASDVPYIIICAHFVFRGSAKKADGLEEKPIGTRSIKLRISVLQVGI